jgi:Fur family zinc uptake transcriptional regulator
MKSHDHGACLAASLAGSESLTPLRRRVLEIVAASHCPLGAYEILKSLASDAPPTVYRALAHLQKSGLVHRIDSRNAYIACFAQTGRPHKSHFLLCRQCGQAHEIRSETLSRDIAQAAARMAFAVERETVEIAGLCAACKGSESAAPHDRIAPRRARQA